MSSTAYLVVNSIIQCPTNKVVCTSALNGIALVVDIIVLEAATAPRASVSRLAVCSLKMPIPTRSHGKDCNLERSKGRSSLAMAVLLLRMATRLNTASLQAASNTCLVMISVSLVMRVSAQLRYFSTSAVCEKATPYEHRYACGNRSDGRCRSVFVRPLAA